MAGSAVLKKITSRAKHLRRLHGGTWKSNVKKAGAEYRAGKIGKVVRMKTRKRRATVKRKKAIKRVHVLHRKEGKAIRALGSIPALRAAMKRAYLAELGDELLRRERATTKTQKRKHQKKIALLKKRIKALE
jgi:hypothetical protein